MTISERIKAARRERRVLARVSRAAWRLEQAERERTLLVPGADWLAGHDVGSAKGSLLQAARDAARGRLLTLGAGLVAVGALLFTARNFMLSREGQVTDRYTKAIEQLGADKLDVRIGGIYALERVARDSAKDHPTVMAVLTAFVREHSREPWPTPDSGAQEGPRSTRPDVQAAVTVVGRRDTRHDIPFQHIDLTGADLGGARLIGAILERANLKGANLADRPDGLTDHRHKARQCGARRAARKLGRWVPTPARTYRAGEVVTYMYQEAAEADL